MMDPEDMTTEILNLKARVLELELTLKHHGIPLMTEAIAQMQAQRRKTDNEALKGMVIVDRSEKP